MTLQPHTDPQSAPARQSIGSRVPGLEIGRWVAACAIVWLHAAAVGPGTKVWTAAGRFAVPFFTLLAVAFTVRSVVNGQATSVSTFARDRFVRLYLPFLFWTVLYMALRFVKNAGSSTGQLLVGPQLLIVGSTHHLWYLPFILIVTVAARVVTPYLMAAPRPVVMTGLAALGFVLGWLELGFPYRDDDPDPLNQTMYFVNLSLNAMPSAIWGLAIGLGFDAMIDRLAGRLWIVGIGIVATIGLLVFDANHPGSSNNLIENASGITFFLATAGLAMKGWVVAAARLGTYSFGIYILHIGFLQLVEKVLRKPRTELDLNDVIITTVVAIPLSMAGTWLLLQSRKSAWLVG